MESVKNVVNAVSDAVVGQRDAKKSDGFAKPKDFASQTQRGEVVGIEAKMNPLPEYEHQEDGYEKYHAANKLVGKKALITGGDSGIGRAVAVMYAMEGADVAIVYLPQEQVDAEVTKKQVEKYGRKCLLLPYDIQIESNCKKAVEETVSGLGGLNILVNNASVMYDTESITDITTEQFDRTIKTNIYGTFWMTKYAVPHLSKGDSIIQTTSQVAYAGPPTLIDYTMTKAAMLGLTRSLSNNLIKKGIRVNSVAPGPVWTPLQPCAMSKEKLDTWHEDSKAPIGRVGQPVELGPAYVFLASSDGSFISGQSIHVNGGTVLNG
ncbi:general stress protein YdaD [Acrasis kona]|uniref:General stress protein YdaD n=1 Tax=Acrasis kona TaxID=1008807 RepID=A0AAW2YVL9_9EUKA